MLWEGSRRLSATDQKIALGLRRPRMAERTKGEVQGKKRIQKGQLDLSGRGVAVEKRVDGGGGGALQR